MSVASVLESLAQSIKYVRPPPMPRITPTVFVVHHDAAVRRSLGSTIRASEWHAEAFGSAEEFLSHPLPFCPSCLVLVTTLPNLTNPGLQKRLAADRTGMPVVLISDCGDVLMTVQPVQAKVADFGATPFDGDRLSSAIRHAVARSDLALRHEEEVQVLRDRHTLLSSREREVMTLVAAGLLNKQVGHELGISEITVKAHRGNVMRKMKAGSLADLVIMAARLRVVHARID